jgi:heavy metal translocating P-type ATPase
VTTDTARLSEGATEGTAGTSTLHEILAAEGWRILLVATAVLITFLVRGWEESRVLAIVAALVAGFPILSEAAESLVKLRMTMELSMSIAIGAALAIGESSTALLILLFVLVAEVLEELNLDRGRRAFSDLASLLPHTAFVEEDGILREVDVDELAAGDIVVVKPGSRIPIDGVVLRGTSTVDQSAITGESLPAEKREQDRVFAGSLNQVGSLVVRVEAIGRDTSFGKIIAVIESSSAARAPVQRLADRLAGWIVFVAILAAIATAIVTRDARAAISVVIVAGACGVAAGTPLAILGGIGQAARRQVIIKGGIFLETLAVVDTVVFDKTGTLTLGQPTVTGVVVFTGSASELISVAATAEQHSEHPVAKAILRAASEQAREVTALDRFTASPGRGIVATTTAGEVLVVGSRGLLEEADIRCPDAPSTLSHGTMVFVGRDGTCLGFLVIDDVERERSSHAIGALREMGVRTLLLTGDNAATARAIAVRVGVDEVDAELLPEQKQRRIQELRRLHKIVAMVGDGINDAPALVEANVGIAMGSGTDVTRESADVVLLGDDPMRVAEVIGIARRCRRIIMQNFAGTIAVDLTGIILAAAGILHPVSAALIHVTSELLFILNSARLLPATDSAESETQQPVPQHA